MLNTMIDVFVVPKFLFYVGLSATTVAVGSNIYQTRNKKQPLPYSINVPKWLMFVITCSVIDKLKKKKNCNLNPVLRWQ